LKIGPRATQRKNSAKKFCECGKICDIGRATRFFARIQKLAPSPAIAARQHWPRLVNGGPISGLSGAPHRVFLNRSRRPRFLRPARFEKRGGRANRRRCARWRRFPSDCRIELHSDMRIVVLCRNFSRRDIRVLSALNKREIRPSEQRRKQCRRQVEGTANAAA